MADIATASYCSARAIRKSLAIGLALSSIANHQSPARVVREFRRFFKLGELIGRDVRATVIYGNQLTHLATALTPSD